MAFYLRLQSPDGRVFRGDAPYEDIAAARDDAQTGAKQIVGDALKGGASLGSVTDGRMFEILDEADEVIDSLAFMDLIDQTKNP